MAKTCGKNLAPGVNSDGRSTCLGERTHGPYCELHREDDGIRRVVCGHPNCSAITRSDRGGWCDRDHSEIWMARLNG